MTFVLRSQMPRRVGIEAGENGRIACRKLGAQFPGCGQPGNKVRPLQVAQGFIGQIAGSGIARFGLMGQFSFEHDNCI